MKNFLLFFSVLALVVTSQVTTTHIQDNPVQESVGTCIRFTSDKNACLECIDHYHLFEGKCYVNIHGCVDYVFGNICRSCEKGFILVNNECCDKHCMARIFKNYEEESAANEETEE